MKQVPFVGPTNIRRHLTKFSRRGGLAPGICASLLYINVTFGTETVTQNTMTAEDFCPPANNNTSSQKSGYGSQNLSKAH